MSASKHILFEELQANRENGLSNLLSIYGQGTKEEKESGLLWYAIALYGCFYLSVLYGINIFTVVKVVACLSPQLRWSDNMMAAELVIRYYLSGAYVPTIDRYYSKTAKLFDLGKEINLPIAANVTGPNKIKALWILQGYDALSGPKVLSFADNIMRLFDSSKVTVDSHAINAWMGILIRQSVALGAPSFYAIIEADYVRLAELIGCSPLMAQAIIWIILRRLSGSDKGDKEIDPRFVPTQEQLDHMFATLGIAI